MSITTKSTPPPSPRAATSPAGLWVTHASEAIFRFLASLKLAVFCLTALAGVLAYATFFEKSHGTAAVQESIYRSPWFAVLLAFLGINILCAALIRFPWKRRQTGFVITHAGLIVVLIGSWLSFKICEEGHLGMLEGERSNQLIREDEAALRVQPIDRATGQVKDGTGYQLAFYPGSYAWESDRSSGPETSAGLRTVAGGLAVVCAAGLAAFAVPWGVGRFRVQNRALGWTAVGLLGLGTALPLAVLSSRQGPRREILTTPEDPFRIVVTDYLPASTPIYAAPEEGPDGVPMVKASLFLKPPRANREIDIFASQDNGTGALRWLKASDPDLGRDSRDLGPLLLTFQYATRPELIEDFLALPADPLKQERIRLRYQDRAGQPRVFDWPNDAPKDKPLVLPDSDLSVKLSTPDQKQLVDLLTTKSDPEARTLLQSFLETMNEAPGFLAVEVTPGTGQPAETYLVASNAPSVLDFLRPNRPVKVRAQLLPAAAVRRGDDARPVRSRGPDGVIGRQDLLSRLRPRRRPGHARPDSAEEARATGRRTEPTGRVQPAHR